MRVAILSGVLAGVLAEIAFLTLHAIVIVPIWWSVAEGLAFVVICGALIGAGLHVVAPRNVLAIGAFLWGSVAITTLLVQAGRLLPVAPHELVEVAMSLAGAALYGAAFGSRMQGTRRAGIAGAVASVAMLVVASGPFLKTTAPAMKLFFGMFPVTCLYAAAFAGFGRILSACAPSNFSPLSFWPFPRSRTRSSSAT